MVAAISHVSVPVCRCSHPAVRARIAVLAALQTVARATPKLVQAHWALFLPVARATAFNKRTPTLLSTLLHDPAARVREAAAGEWCHRGTPAHRLAHLTAVPVCVVA